MWPTESCHFRWPWVTFKVMHISQTYWDASLRRTVQRWTWFQLTVVRPTRNRPLLPSGRRRRRCIPRWRVLWGSETACTRLGACRRCTGAAPARAATCRPSRARRRPCIAAGSRRTRRAGGRAGPASAPRSRRARPGCAPSSRRPSWSSTAAVMNLDDHHKARRRPSWSAWRGCETPRWRSAATTPWRVGTLRTLTVPRAREAEYATSLAVGEHRLRLGIELEDAQEHSDTATDGDNASSIIVAHDRLLLQLRPRLAYQTLLVVTEQVVIVVGDGRVAEWRRRRDGRRNRTTDELRLLRYHVPHCPLASANTRRGCIPPPKRTVSKPPSLCCAERLAELSRP